MMQIIHCTSPEDGRMMQMQIIQGSDAWHQARLGKLTASRFADAIAKTRTGWGASRDNLMAALIVERLTGVPQDTYTNAAMQHGIDTEPEARAAYSFTTGADVTEIGFVPHPTIAMSGCSPDGLIDATYGMIEIKCPASATHLATLLGAAIPDKYIVQMQWQMACCGRHWCDWVSYDPRMPEDMRLYVKRIARDPVHIANLESEAGIFLAELDGKMDALAKIYGTKVAA